MTVKFFASGDVVNSRNNQNFLDTKLEEIIQSCDISICNLEAPVETTGMKPLKKAGPNISQARDSIKHLKRAGFNFVSLANNHIYDFGQNSLLETLKELQLNKIGFVGGGSNFDEAYQTKIFEKDGLKIGLVAGGENGFGCLTERQDHGGYSWLLSEKIEDNIRLLRESVDFVVLIAHAGVEEIEIPIKEWRDKYRRFCDIGVDIVIGHHPHVPQGYEQYRDSLIFYSLGNFYFDTPTFNHSSDDSYSLVFNFEKGEKIYFELIYHKKIAGRTSLAKETDVNFDLKLLNKLLDEDYDKRNNEICLKLLNQYYYGYYEYAVGALPQNSNYKQIAKYLIKRLLLKKENMDYKNLLLLHNIKIDSHRFVVQRALSLISE